MLEINTKKCKECGEVKSLDHFYQQNKYSKTKGNYIYYNPKCKECVIKIANDYQKDNREEINEKRRDYFKVYFKNPEQKIKRRDISRKRMKEGKFLKWQRENLDKLKGYHQKRNEKKHTISNKEWSACKKYFDYSCAYCGLSEKDHKLIYNQQLHKEHVDHEGANNISNCIPSCKTCNSSKHICELEDWYNEDNERFNEERLYKIKQWLESDYQLYKDE